MVENFQPFFKIFLLYSECLFLELLTEVLFSILGIDLFLSPLFPLLPCLFPHGYEHSVSAFRISVLEL